MSQEISQKEIDSIRKSSFRPQVAICLVHDKKVFMFYKEKYKLWQFPQGGINNGETIKSATIRELNEEMGIDLSKHIVKDPVVLFEDKISFPERLWGSRSLVLDDGLKMMMKGKHFFYIALEIDLDSFDMEATEFDEFELVNAAEAEGIVNQIYQFNKQRISQRAIDFLEEEKIIS